MGEKDILLYNLKLVIREIIIVFKYILLYDGAKSHYSGTHLQPLCHIVARNESFNYSTHMQSAYTLHECECSVIEHYIVIVIII